jgi:AraC-like DNA-binding protein
MDALADILKTIRLHTSTYFCSDFNSPWGMQVEPSSNGIFHVMVEGSGWLQASNHAKPTRLEQGDIVAFPTGGAHWISDEIDTAKLHEKEAVERIIKGDNPFYIDQLPTLNTLLCGAFDYDTSINHPFLKALPCFIHIKASNYPELEWLRSLVQIVAVESKQASPGSSIVVDRLTEVLFIQLLRVYMQEHHQEDGYLIALNDHKIGKVLNLIHNEVDTIWTVNTLADEAALSRSAFTERFTKLVGESPKTYLMNWRMQKAKLLLRDNKLIMQDIAEISGYASEASFSKAFKHMFDTSPGAYRRAI